METKKDITLKKSLKKICVFKVNPICCFRISLLFPSLDILPIVSFYNAVLPFKHILQNDFIPFLPYMFFHFILNWIGLKRKAGIENWKIDRKIRMILNWRKFGLRTLFLKWISFLIKIIILKNPKRTTWT